MTAAAQNSKLSLSDLTKIPEKEFEKEFRDWMERDGVARALQSKLRCDLILNFNKTSLGKRLIAETTNRLTLSSNVLALHTLVAEFLYSQDCHFTLSVFCTEVPFRNALPDFENQQHFRFKEVEILDIMKAVCNESTIDWNTKNKLVKNYSSHTSTSLLFHIIQVLLEKNAENMRKKITIGTNTRATESIILESPQNAGVQSTQRDERADFYNQNFRYLNKYLIILSRKVGEMTKQIEALQRQQYTKYGLQQPRIRVLKSGRHRKYEDLNQSLERVTANLKQMVSGRRKSKYVDAIVRAIDRLAAQFQKCAANFEVVSKNLESAKHKTHTRGTQMGCSSTHTTTAESSVEPKPRPRSMAASQTETTEKSYSDWLHEMRYTRNGQKFLDRVERSLRKAMDNQKRELLLENEVRMRHHCELMKIRYKQKQIEQMCLNSGEHVETADGKQEIKESISEQFRQFELKHFNLLSKIYDTEIENRPPTAAKPEAPILPASTAMPSYLQVDETRPCIESDPLEFKATPSSELCEQIAAATAAPQSSLNIRQHIRAAVDGMAEEERIVNKIVHDAKMRIRELEQDSNQITDNFLEYLERQRKQKLDARDAAQNLWNDYLIDENVDAVMHVNSNVTEAAEKSKILENLRKQILYNPHKDDGEEKEGKKVKRQSKNSSNSNTETCNTSSSHTSSNYLHKNPISKAKEDFFERERIFKEESERILNNHQQDAAVMQLLESNTINPSLSTSGAGKKLDMPFELLIHEPTKLTFPAGKKQLKASLSNSIMIAQLLNDSYNDSCSDFNMFCGNTSAAGPTKRTATAATTRATTMFEGNNRNGEVLQNTDRMRRGGDYLTASKKQTIILPATATATAASSSEFLRTNTIAMTLNSSAITNVERRSSFGVGFVETPPQETTHFQNDVQKSEANNNHKSYCYNDNNNNNNNTHYNNNNDNKDDISNQKRNSSAESRRERQESSKSTSTKSEAETRKSLLQESMARMQQLFTPREQREQEQQKKRQQRKQKQEHNHHREQILEDARTEWNEVPTEELKHKSNKTSTIEEKQRSSNSSRNQTTKDFLPRSGSENVVSYCKNNFKMQETMEQEEKQKTSPPSSIERIDNGAAATTAIQAALQQNGATKTSSNNGNKAIEGRRRDWQKIGSGTSSGKSASKVSDDDDEEEEAKAGKGDVVEEEIAVVTGEVNVAAAVAAVEPGEIIEDDDNNNKERFVARPNSVLRAQQRREIDKLIESNDAAAAYGNFTHVSIQSSASSSTELEFSHIGGVVGGVGGSGGGRGDGVGRSNALLDGASGSDSNSDFWT